MTKYTLKQVNDIICNKIDNVELNNCNIRKMLQYDIDITDCCNEARIVNNKIVGYGIFDPQPPMDFKEYIPWFKDACDWAIAGGGACEEPETLLKKFNDLNLTFKEVEKMNVKEIYNKMTDEDKKAMTQLFFEEEVEDLYGAYYDDPEALVQKDKWNTFMTKDEQCHLQDDLFNCGTLFAPIDLERAISVKWTAQYHFIECLKDMGCEKVRKAIEKAIPGANVVIVTPEALEEVLVLEVKEKIIDELI